MNSISWQDIRKVIINFLTQRLANNSSYKSELVKLAKARENNDSLAITESQQKINDLLKRYDFETWMEDAATRRIFWISIASHISKGIHSSSLGDNNNYLTQTKPINQTVISSATLTTLPLDCSGNAAALDIFSLLNQVVTGETTLLQLIIEDHPAVLDALSDDKQKASLYLVNLKKAIFNEFEHPKASELNKQFYWPNSQESYLAHLENNYRLLVPLHPSSLCHVVYQKVQERFSEQNKKAREQRRIKDAVHEPYFSFQNLAVVKLGGSNPQGVSQLTSNQGGRNFLLPSIPPEFKNSEFPSITDHKQNIFDNSMQYFCRFGFRLLFDMVQAPKNVVEERDNRKDALDIILSYILKFAKHIQQTMPAGWSREYSLKLNQKLWLDPNRAELEDEEDFKQYYDKGDWLVGIKQDFAFWIQCVLKNKFNDISEQFSDPEFNEWCSEFSAAVKASQRKKEGIF